MEKLKRRQFVVASLAALLLEACGQDAVSTGPSQLGHRAGNFQAVYGDATQRGRFLPFLTNVFHLFPEHELHALIARVVQRGGSDEATYRALQAEVDAVAPTLGLITHALPALAKQKAEMTRQTTALLGKRTEFSGYLEVGSEGRYLDALEEQLSVTGARYFLSTHVPGFGPEDVVDRGQLQQAGTHISLSNYAPRLAKVIPPASLDLVTVYIGFHHCPLPLRKAFFAQLRGCLTEEGILILRDHDVTNDADDRLVALAHDVFNMGTGEPWAANAAELRHFYSLDGLEGMMAEAGFRRMGERLFQPGDPTKNALMAYRKV